MDQATLSENGLLYDIQWMPSNWVGSYVLENSQVPYALIRTVEWGTLEQIGEWMRFTTKYDIPVEQREQLWRKIREMDNEEPCLINVTMGLKSFQHSPKQFHQKRANQFIDVQMHV